MNASLAREVSGQTCSTSAPLHHTCLSFRRPRPSSPHIPRQEHAANFTKGSSQPQKSRRVVRGPRYSTARCAATEADAAVPASPGAASQVASRKPPGKTKKTSFGFATDFAERYELGDKIGKGSFGTVNIAIDRVTGLKYAVKTMMKRFGPDGALEANFVRRIEHEVDVLQHVGASLNVAYCYGVFEQPQCVGIVMELLSGGELWSRIRAEHYSEAGAAKIVRDILQTIAQCHCRGVIVRDVKPENFLFLNDEPSAPLRAIDFGLAEYCKRGETLTDKAGTVIYVAPEVLRGRYTLSADLWSVGVIAYQLLTGRLPFSGEDGDEVTELYMQKQLFENKEVFRAVLYSPLDFERAPWDSISADARDLVQALLQRDASRRPTAQEALSHRWLQEGGDQGSDHHRPLSTSIVQRLQRFGTYGRLKQVALRSVAHSLAADSAALTDLREMFDVLDPDHRGFISHEAMLQALQSGQFELSRTEVERLLAALEVEPDGEIAYDDWIAALVDWRAVQESPQWDEWIAEAFAAFCDDGSGRLSRDALNAMLCGEVCVVSDTVESAIREADNDKDGSISLQDFEALLRTGPDEVLSLFQARLRESYLPEDDKM